MKNSLLFLLCILLPLTSQAVKESLLEDGAPTILIEHMKNANKGSFTTKDGFRIAYITYLKCNNNKPVVVIPGLSEAYTQWAEMTYDLCQAGYGPIFQMDLRGQGFSDRSPELLNKMYSHVDDFNNYITDFKQFMNKVVQPELIRMPNVSNIYLVAHSTGGLVAASYLTQHQGVFDKAVLISPYFGIKVPGGNLAAKLWMTIKGLWSDKLEPVSDFQLTEEFDPDNRFSHSKARWTLHKNNRPKEIEYTSITRGWVLESIAASTKLKSNAAKLTTPTLIIESGEDIIVRNADNKEIARKSEKVTVKRVEGARHGLHAESDKYRDKMMKFLTDFLK